MSINAAAEAEVVRIAGLTVHYIARHPYPRTPDHQAVVERDLAALRSAIDVILGEEEDEELATMQAIKASVDANVVRLDLLTDLTREIHEAVTVPPSAVWVYTYKGRSFSRRTPASMPVIIKDADAGWGVRVTDLVDAAGEAVTGPVTVVFSVDDPVIALNDHGDGSADFSVNLTDFSTPLPLDVGIHAAVTNADGSSLIVSDVITVTSGPAVSGLLTFTPPA